jgi:glutathione S-transferase
MSLKLYFHPLSSFCQKALTALYENDTPFEPVIVDLFDEASSAEFRNLWPIGKFPVLRDEAKDRTIPESSIIIEYLDQNYPGRTAFIPKDQELARQMRFRDRFFDLYLNVPMQKVVTDRLRPEGNNDHYGVEEARKQLATALGLLDGRLRRSTPALLCQYASAARRHLQECRGLSCPPQGTAILRSRAQGSRTLSQACSEVRREVGQ